MATTQEIDAAVALVTSTRVTYAAAQTARAKAVTVRDLAAADLVSATGRLQTTRDAMNAAKTNLLALLAQTET